MAMRWTGRSFWRAARATTLKRSSPSAVAAAPRTFDERDNSDERDKREDEATVSKVDLIRRPMPKQEPWERVRNFDEVALGYTDALAREEAARCLACRKPGCVDGCPVGVDIPGFVSSIAAGEFAAAIRMVKQTNASVSYTHLRAH